MQETTSFGIIPLRQNAPVPHPQPPPQQHIEEIGKVLEYE